MGKHGIKKEYRFLFKTILAVVVLWCIVIAMFRIGYDRSQNFYLSAEMESLKSKVEATLKTYEIFSNYIFEDVVNNDAVLAMMYDANHTDEAGKDVIRKQLYNMLESDYRRMLRYDFRQLHFHLPNSDSFLRMHRPDQYGDSLYDVRETVRIANEEQRYVFGFEEGRIYNGYRFVYPLVYQGEHLGSVEVSLSMATLMEVLSRQYQNLDTYFILDKEIVDSTLFESEQGNYIVSENFQGYVYDKEVLDVALTTNDLMDQASAETLLSKIKEPFIEGSKRKESFEIIETAAGKTYLIRFLALQDVKGIPVGYFIGVKENQTLAIEKQDFFIECSLVTLLMILFFATSLVYVRSQVRINEISMRDNLTKLYNRHKFNTFAESELQRCKRYGGNFSLLMIDIDFFKRVNDTYGHLQGDAVLKELAEIFINTLRVNDLVARWGGEEFICCLPNTNGEEAMIVAEKLRKRVEDNVFNIVGHITISIGATEVTADDDNLNGPIARADDGLYASKHNGRNKVTLM